MFLAQDGAMNADPLRISFGSIGSFHMPFLSGEARRCSLGLGSIGGGDMNINHMRTSFTGIDEEMSVTPTQRLSDGNNVGIAQLSNPGNAVEDSMSQNHSYSSDGNGVVHSDSNNSNNNVNVDRQKQLWNVLNSNNAPAKQLVPTCSMHLPFPNDGNSKDASSAPDTIMKRPPSAMSVDESINDIPKGKVEKKAAPRRKSASGSTSRVKVDHSYKDYSLVPDDKITSIESVDEYAITLEECLELPDAPPIEERVRPSAPKRQGKTCFPLVLMRILLYTELSPIITWLKHGRSFIVRDNEGFVSEIMPRFYKLTQFKSFIRQLSLWGFKRITKGPDSGSYYNQFFLRGKPKLVLLMKCEKVKGTGVKLAPNPDFEPNFHALADKRPLPHLLPSKYPLPAFPGDANANIEYGNRALPYDNYDRHYMSHEYHGRENYHFHPDIRRGVPYESRDQFDRDRMNSRRVSGETTSSSEARNYFYGDLYNEKDYDQMHVPTRRSSTGTLPTMDQIARRRTLIADQHAAIMSACPRRVSMDSALTGRRSHNGIPFSHHNKYYVNDEYESQQHSDYNERY